MLEKSSNVSGEENLLLAAYSCSVVVVISPAYGSWHLCKRARSLSLKGILPIQTRAWSFNNTFWHIYDMSFTLIRQLCNFPLGGIQTCKFSYCLFLPLMRMELSENCILVTWGDINIFDTYFFAFKIF